MIPTRDHHRIQKWAQGCGAYPAQIRRLKFDGEPAVLTFVFGENADLGPDIFLISWESFFAQFDLMQLSMVWDEKTPRFHIVRVEKRSATYPPQ